MKKTLLTILTVALVGVAPHFAHAASPVVQSTSSGGGGYASSFVATMPSGITAGDLLVVIVKDNSYNSSFGSWATGYQLLTAGGSHESVAWRTATGDTNDNLTITLAGSDLLAYTIYRISGSNGAVQVTSNSYGLTPPAITPIGGSDDFLWIAVATYINTGTVSAYPSGYSGGNLSSYGLTGNSLMNVASAYKQSTGSSETPGAFTISGTANSPYSFTLAIGATTDVTTNLTAWWKLDEGSGTTAADSSGNGYTGTLVNSPTWITGQVGGGLQFDGSTNYVSTALTPDISAGTTMAMWIYSPSTPSGTNYFFGSYNGRYHLSLNTSNQLLVGLGANILLISAAVISPGSWHFVAVTANASTYSVFLDGNLVSTGNSWTYGSVSFPVYLGARNFQNGTPNYGAESLDNIYVFSRELSMGDLTALYTYSPSPAVASIPHSSFTTFLGSVFSVFTGSNFTVY